MTTPPLAAPSRGRTTTACAVVAVGHAAVAVGATRLSGGEPLVGWLLAYAVCGAVTASAMGWLAASGSETAWAFVLGLLVASLLLAAVCVVRAPLAGLATAGTGAAGLLFLYAALRRIRAARTRP